MHFSLEFLSVLCQGSWIPFRSIIANPNVQLIVYLIFPFLGQCDATLKLVSLVGVSLYLQMR